MTLFSCCFRVQPELPRSRNADTEEPAKAFPKTQSATSHRGSHVSGTSTGSQLYPSGAWCAGIAFTDYCQEQQRMPDKVGQRVEWFLGDVRNGTCQPRQVAAMQKKALGLWSSVSITLVSDHQSLLYSVLLFVPASALPWQMPHRTAASLNPNKTPARKYVG